MKRLIFSLLAIAVIASFNVTIFAGDGIEPISLEVATAPGAICKQRHIPLKLTFKNNSKTQQTLFIGKDRYLGFEIFSKDEKKVSSPSCYLPSDQIIELAPGKAWTLDVELCKGVYKTFLIGKVNLLAIYSKIKKDENEKYYTGTIASDPIEFEILPPDEKMEKGYISKEDAIRIARPKVARDLESIKHYKDLIEVLPPEAILDEGVYYVNFPMKWERGTIGAGVPEQKIDARTGKIIQDLPAR